MTTITQMQEQVQYLFGERAEQLAKETGFLQRQRKLSGTDFVQGLVFGLLANPKHSTEELACLLGRRAVAISASGLCQRFTDKAVTFLIAIVKEAIALGVGVEPPPVELLSRFEEVILEDSTTIRLPNKMALSWPSCGGGQGQSKAGLKIHVRWDLRSGKIADLGISPSRVSDQSSEVRKRGIAAGVLNIADVGYCNLQWLKKQAGFFLCRPRATTCFLDPSTGEELDLEQIGPLVTGQVLDRPVLVGKAARLPVRLIMLRVPEEVAAKRQERIRKEAKRLGRANVNAQALARATWTILMANVPSEKLTTSEVIVLQRARWQIERLFRLWKEDGQIDEWRGRTPSRILCELLAKLLAMLLQHWLLLLGTWNDSYRSLVKAAKQVRLHALELLSALAGEGCWSRVMQRLIQAMQGCRVHRRTKHPCHAQLLCDGLDWDLFEENPCLT